MACSKEQPIAITAENFTEKELLVCDTVTCPEITVNYVKIAGDDERSNMINSVIHNFIIDALYLGDAAVEPSATTISEAATQFVQMYRTHSAEFPEMQLEYFAEINIRETYSSGRLLSLEFHQYRFTGGAHGYGATHFANFDAQTGEEISANELFADMDEFRKLAEIEFRKAYEIPKTGSINATGFWFEDDSFYLPEAIGISNSNVIMVYNQYDIASYADGPIEFEIPLTDVKSLLSLPLQ